MSRAALPSSVRVATAFEPDCALLQVSALLPVRTLTPALKTTQKYRQIVASIQEVGLVEAPVVARTATPGSYLLLDGHIRIEALKDLGIQEIECLVATDDEAFTYNKRISRLSAIQEHRMIRRAIDRGVPEEKIAKALDINPESVRRKVRMLEGICAETVSILKDKPCPMIVFETLRKMKSLRQIEAAELLVNANNYSAAYAAAILASTPQSQLLEGAKPKRVMGVSPETVARMERELSRLQESITSIQESYGKDHLHLTVIKGYISKLLGNPRIVRYLMQHRAEFLSEFQTIAEMTSTLPVEHA